MATAVLGAVSARRPSYHARPLAGAAEFALTWRDRALLLMFGLSLLLMNLGGARALTYHEITFATPAKEMLRDGHWIVPTIAGTPFTDKPPLTAWLIAGSLTLFQTDAEWAARLPSALSAATCALLVATLAARWWGRRIGLYAGSMYLTSMVTVMLGRLAESDIHLCTTVAGALLAFAWANVESPEGRSSARWLPWAFFAFLGLSFLTKALPGPVFVLGACGMYLVWSQDLRGFRFFVSPIGWLIFGLLAVPWFALAARAYPPMLDNLLLHHFGRFKGNMGAHEPWYAYFYLIPMLLLPWTPLAILACWRGLRDGLFLLPAYRFLICWVVPGLTLLSLSAFKAKHYTAPLLPPLVILGALGLARYLAWRRSTVELHSPWLWACTGLGTLTAIFAFLILEPAAKAGLIATALVLGAGVCVMIALERARRPDWIAGAAFATAWLTISTSAWLVLPAHDSYRPLASFSTRVDRLPESAAPLFMVRLPDNVMTYYLARPVARFDEEALFAQALLEQPFGEMCFVLAPRKSEEFLAAQGSVEVIDQAGLVGKHANEANRVTLFRVRR